MIDIPSHSGLEERIDVARRLREEMGMDSSVEVLVDNMEDSFNKEFAAWPIRYFIAKEGVLLHKTENSIENDLFDQDSLQNFFRGLGFVREHIPRKKYVYKAQKISPNFEPVEPVTRMLHFSSIELLVACCCSPCICIAVPCYLCVDMIRQRVKRN